MKPYYDDGSPDQPRRSSPLGPLLTTRTWRKCSRSMDGTFDEATLCNRDATMHVFWTDDGENGWCCDEHAAEVRGRWVFVGLHAINGNCGMPGSFYLHPPQDTCVGPDADGSTVPDAGVELPVEVTA